MTPDDAGKRVEAMAATAAVHLALGGGLYSTAWMELADRVLALDLAGVDAVIRQANAQPRTRVLSSRTSVTSAPVPDPQAAERLRLAHEMVAKVRAEVQAGGPGRYLAAVRYLDALVEQAAAR